MSKWDKLLKKLYTLDPDIRLEEICRIMEYYGYEPSYPRGGSSHITFRKEGTNSVTLPVHGRIKKIYLKQLRKIVEEEQVCH